MNAMEMYIMLPLVFSSQPVFGAGLYVFILTSPLSHYFKPGFYLTSSFCLRKYGMWYSVISHVECNILHYL